MSKATTRTRADSAEWMTRRLSLFFCCIQVVPCSKRFTHDWTECPFAHPKEKAVRRDPAKFNYTGIACPSMKEGGSCTFGDSCPYAHNAFEYWLHPTRYRTQMCKEGTSCTRKICFFAHDETEIRVPDSKPCISPESLRAASNKASDKSCRMSSDSHQSYESMPRDDSPLRSMPAPQQQRRQMLDPLGGPFFLSSSAAAERLGKDDIVFCQKIISMCHSGTITSVQAVALLDQFLSEHGRSVIHAVTQGMSHSAMSPQDQALAQMAALRASEMSSVQYSDPPKYDFSPSSVGGGISAPRSSMDSSRFSGRSSFDVLEDRGLFGSTWSNPLDQNRQMDSGNQASGSQEYLNAFSSSFFLPSEYN
jgi:hypothetical protein